MDDGPATVVGAVLTLITGQRWSLAIVAALGAGPRRFGALRSAIPGLSANLLTRRLEALGDAGIVKRIELPPPASVAAYALTPWGDELGPIVAGLDRWARRGRSRPLHADRASPEADNGAHP